MIKPKFVYVVCYHDFIPEAVYTDLELAMEHSRQHGEGYDYPLRRFELNQLGYEQWENGEWV